MLIQFGHISVCGQKELLLNIIQKSLKKFVRERNDSRDPVDEKSGDC